MSKTLTLPNTVPCTALKVDSSQGIGRTSSPSDGCSVTGKAPKLCLGSGVMLNKCRGLYLISNLTGCVGELKRTDKTTSEVCPGGKFTIVENGMTSSPDN